MISPDGSIEGGEESMLLFFRSCKWSSHELCLLRSTCAVLAALVANLLEEGMRVVTVVSGLVKQTNVTLEINYLSLSIGGHSV